MTRREKRRRARDKALRAAQAVTLGAMVAMGGCAAAHEPVGDATVPDSSADGSTDAVADTGGDCTAFPPTTRVCCDDVGGFWDGATGSCSVAVPGPFVPPSMAG